MENPSSATHQTNSIDDKSSDVTLGKSLVITVIALVIAMSLTVTVTSNVIQGQGKLPIHAIRFSLEVLLIVSLYNGYPWARHVMVVLFGLGGMFSLTAVLMMGAGGDPLGKALLGVLGIGYMACAIVLAAVPSVGRFMESQRRSSDVTVGKFLVIAVIAFVMVMSLTVIVITNVIQEQGKLPTQAVRFSLEVLLVVCLYNGYSWARYVMVVLFGLGGMFSLAALLTTGAGSDPLGKALLGVLGIGYTACTIILTAVPSVGRFMESQRLNA